MRRKEHCGIQKRHIEQDTSGVTSLAWLEKFGICIDENFNCKFAWPYRKIEQSLQDYTRKLEKEDLDELIETFSSKITEMEILEKWLKSDTDVAPSFLRILLGIDRFQCHVLTQISQFFVLTEFEDDVAKLRKVSLQIVRCMAYLPRIVDPNHVTDTIFTSIEKCHSAVKHILIQNLFQMVESNGEIVEKLMDILLESVDMTSEILMSLEVLPLTNDERDRFRKHILNNILQAVPTKDLPTVVKFLIATTDEENASSTVDSIRLHLSISDQQFVADTLSVDDAYMFLIRQIREALQFNTYFLKSYLTAFEFAEGELGVIDVWTIFCLFSISRMQSKAQSIIQKMSGKVLSKNSIVRAIVGHEKSIIELKHCIVQLMSWCLSSNDRSTVEIGTTLASTIFSEFTDRESLCDVASALAIQVGLGEGKTPELIVDLLDTLSLEYPDKLQEQCPIIEGILWSNDSLSLSIFGRLATICSRLIYRDEESIASAQSQLHISFSKMMYSNNQEMRKTGLVGLATLINRYDDVLTKDHSKIDELYTSIMRTIDEDTSASSLFFKCLYLNRNRSTEFNRLLIKKLTKYFQIVFAKNNESIYGDEESENCIDIATVVNQPLRQMRGLETRARNAVVTFASYGIMLLLDCYTLCGDNLREVCAELFMMPMRLLADRTRNETITCLLLAHSYLMQLLNFFCTTVDDNCFTKFSYLLSIEDRILEEIDEIDKYTNPFYGDVFPRHSAFLKKQKDAEYKSLLFYDKYRSSFMPPKAAFFNMVREIPIPVPDGDLKTLYHMLIDYQYVLSPCEKGLFECEQYQSLEIIEFLANTVLPSIIEDDREIAILITVKIFAILQTQISLPMYKDKIAFEELISHISSGSDRRECFMQYSKMMTDDLSQDVRLALLLFLKAILHSGPVTKLDICGRECKRMCKLSKKLLTSQAPVLSKSGVKAVLPLFFEHNEKILDDVHIFITAVFTLDILDGNKSDTWSSLVPETFPLFFNQCFMCLNKKLGEIKKKIHSNSFIISEEAVETIMNRMNKIGALTKGLLLHTCTMSIPKEVLRSVLRQGVTWLDTSVALFPFLNDARECDDKEVREFLEFSRFIKRQLQVVVDHVRRNEKTLHSLLPSISKSLASWNYSLKSSIRIQTDEILELSRSRERTLLGELILTQVQA